MAPVCEDLTESSMCTLLNTPLTLTLDSVPLQVLLPKGQNDLMPSKPWFLCACILCQAHLFWSNWTSYPTLCLGFQCELQPWNKQETRAQGMATRTMLWAGDSCSSEPEWVKLWLYGLHQAYVDAFSMLICTLQLLKYIPSSATINWHPLPVWQTITGAEAEQELILVNENSLNTDWNIALLCSLTSELLKEWSKSNP